MNLNCSWVRKQRVSDCDPLFFADDLVLWAGISTIVEEARGPLAQAASGMRAYFRLFFAIFIVATGVQDHMCLYFPEALVGTRSIAFSFQYQRALGSDTGSNAFLE